MINHRANAYRLNHHRRRCNGPCKEWKYIKGGTMRGTGKGMGRLFYCQECK